MGQEELAATQASVGTTRVTLDGDELRKMALKFTGRAIDRGLVGDLRRVLEVIGLIPTVIEAVFEDCGHPQTEENTTYSRQGSSGRLCKRCKNSPTQRAMARHPRKKAGAA